MAYESGKGKIFCANCIHCKLLKGFTDDGDTKLQVRCASGHWRKKLGEEKIYKYSTISRRTITECVDYDEMGDTKPLLKDLKRNISRDTIYNID